MDKNQNCAHNNTFCLNLRRISNWFWFAFIVNIVCGVELTYDKNVTHKFDDNNYIRRLYFI